MYCSFVQKYYICTKNLVWCCKVSTFYLKQQNLELKKIEKMTFNDYIESFPKATTSVRHQKICEIAKECSVDPSAVYSWLKGRHAVRPIYKKIIAQITGISESELFPTTEAAAK